MVRASTQQVVDRIVGTAVVLGLSAAFVRWMTSGSSGKSTHDRGSGYQSPNESEQSRLNEVKEERKERGEVAEPAELVEHDDEEHEHRGSCHCRSIIFVVSPLINQQILKKQGTNA